MLMVSRRGIMHSNECIRALRRIALARTPAAVHSPQPSVSLGASMDLFQLETFLAVAEERSFSRAAGRLRRTRPAVSQIIAKREGELGGALLDRASREGELTDAGGVLRDDARKMLNLRAEAAGA